ncbi:MAG TPA: cupin domain-containing protein [Anaerolineales bacterium]|jgi:mannose-6-phosphate isomerase-like protein (cupin superfamily)
MYATKLLPAVPDVTAPDGSDVRVLLALEGGSMAHFELFPGRTSAAVVHATAEEIWYILGGKGEMWRSYGGNEAVVTVEANVCVTIPRGTRFQFRSFGPEPLAAVAITMPPWSGDAEARVVGGYWDPDLGA